MKSALALTSLSTAIMALTATATPHKRTTYSGHLTPIGETVGALTSCGQTYEADSMFVAVDPTLLAADCVPKTMTINCPNGQVTARAVDKCIDCDTTHIDVASAVYAACGGTESGVDPIHGISWSF